MANRPLCKCFCGSLKWWHHSSWLWSLVTSCLHPVCPSPTPHGSVPFHPSNLPRLFSGYQVELPNLISETVQPSLSNTAKQSAKAHVGTAVATVHGAKTAKLPPLTSLNPLNLLKHKACRTTHGKGSQEEQVQRVSPSRCCVSEDLWGYGYFQTVHRPQEVSSHATIQDTSPESSQAALLKLRPFPWWSQRDSIRPPSCTACVTVLMSEGPGPAAVTPDVQSGWPASICKPAVPSFRTAGRKLTRFR